MILPNPENLRVDEEKILDYLLDPKHIEGGGKAQFFQRFGFTRAQWRDLADALKKLGRNYEVIRVVESPYGVKYIVDGELDAPDGRRPTVRTVWIADKQDDGAPSDSVRLVTAHPA